MLANYKTLNLSYEECATAEGVSPWDTSLCTWPMLASKLCENISTCWEAYIHVVDDGMLIGVFLLFFEF
jgi:hypothetical protein